MSESNQHKIHYLVHETKETKEYLPERALRLWSLLSPELPKDGLYGYEEDDTLTDEDRIISLHDILAGSMLGNHIFGDRGGDWDHGSTLMVRGEDE